ncbi:MAG TPA: RHS repeat-associated core domain-containing protein [Longimicrobium sp.]|nr:RHS repeat-associated core domain-containing protein [Longimicrobium sp.]
MASESTHNLLRFAARELDALTGMYYVRARWYDPFLGRFLSEDPIGLAGGNNQYAYALNDPVNLSDPSGLDHRCNDSFVSGGTTVIVSYPGGCDGYGHRPGDYEPYDPNRRGDDSGPLGVPGHSGGGYPHGPGSADDGDLADDAVQLAKEVAACALDHYGLDDLAARDASWLGAVPIDKRRHGMPVMPGKTRSASLRTNALNYYGHKVLGPLKIPGKWPRAILGSNSLVTLAGRANLVVAAGLLLYDVVSIGACVASN